MQSECPPIPIPDMLIPEEADAVLLDVAIPAMLVIVGDMAIVDVPAGIVIESMPQSPMILLLETQRFQDVV